MMCDRLKIFTLSKGCQIYESKVYINEIKQCPYAYTLYLCFYKSIRTMCMGIRIYINSNNTWRKNNLVV